MNILKNNHFRHTHTHTEKAQASYLDIHWERSSVEIVPVLGLRRSAAVFDVNHFVAMDSVAVVVMGAAVELAAAALRHSWEFVAVVVDLAVDLLGRCVGVDSNIA